MNMRQQEADHGQTGWKKVRTRDMTLVRDKLNGWITPLDLRGSDSTTQAVFPESELQGAIVQGVFTQSKPRDKISILANLRTAAQN